MANHPLERLQEGVCPCMAKAGRDAVQKTDNEAGMKTDSSWENGSDADPGDGKAGLALSNDASPSGEASLEGTGEPGADAPAGISGAVTASGALAPAADPARSLPWRQASMGLLALAAWFALYGRLPALSRLLTYDLLGLARGSHLADSMEFFLYDTPKVLMLLVLVVFGVGLVRSFFTPERTRRLLAGRREFTGNVLAALLGTVTPFCSCSAVPLFIGFVAAGVPLGVTFSFLVSAPMVNEIAVFLLYGLLGWKVAAIYTGTGLIVAIVSGWVIGRLKLENHVEDWVRDITAGGDAPDESLTWRGRVDYAVQAVRDIVGRVWKYVVLGIAVGAGIHGFVPEGWMAGIMGQGNWWSVPLAVLMGVPMYSNAAGIVPVVEALLGKGAALGTTLAFMMSVIALSLPEAVILRKVLKPRLIAVFFGVVALGILAVGWLFNTII